MRREEKERKEGKERDGEEERKEDDFCPRVHLTNAAAMAPTSRLRPGT